MLRNVGEVIPWSLKKQVIGLLLKEIRVRRGKKVILRSRKKQVMGLLEEEIRLRSEKKVIL